jgi:uncharacterized surface protein with fasciclin (FAS1) repeats
MLNRYRVIGVVLIAILVLTVAPAVFGAFSPEVFVIDQPTIDNTVNVTRATVSEPGWVVIHADEDGAPGPVIGYSALPAGINANIKVSLDAAGITGVLYAMLHDDKGAAGVFDAADTPVERNDEAVTRSFAVTGTESTVVKLLEDDKEFSTLVAALKAAGLADTVRAEKGVTIFAPSNAAFSDLNTGVLRTLLADTAGLSQVLLYHVVPGVVTAADITPGEVESLQGAPLTLAVSDDGAVTVNGANVVEADRTGFNGVIHVVDQVLIPPAPAPTEAAAAEETVAEATGEPANVVAAALGSSDLSTLVEAVTAAGLGDALAGEGPFTVFAPTNAAFAALPEGTLAALLADPEQLSAVLQYHVLSGAVPSSDVTDGMTATALDGSPLTFSVKSDGVYVNDAKVVTPDVVTGNGRECGCGNARPDRSGGHCGGDRNGCGGDGWRSCARRRLDCGCGRRGGEFHHAAGCAPGCRPRWGTGGGRAVHSLCSDRRCVCGAAGRHARCAAGRPRRAQECAALPCCPRSVDGRAVGSRRSRDLGAGQPARLCHAGRRGQRQQQPDRAARHCGKQRYHSRDRHRPAAAADGCAGGGNGSRRGDDRSRH